jgi:hypothetical protein
MIDGARGREGGETERVDSPSVDHFILSIGTSVLAPRASSFTEVISNTNISYSEK